MAVVAEIKPADAMAPIVAEANKLLEQEKLPEASKLLESHLKANPDDAQALTVYASVLKKAGSPAAAYYAAKYSVELRPDRPETWNTLGHTSQHLWRMDEATSCYRKALQRARSDKQRSLYNNNLGSANLDIGKFTKAEPYLREAVRLMPEDKLSQHNLGLSLLAQRNWQEGWKYYAASIGTYSRVLQKYKNPPEPIWDGSKDKTVVVYGEQGLGDEICAASMLPDVIRDCKRVIVDCDHRLANLFSRSFPEATVYGTRWAPKEEGKRWNETSDCVDASISAFEVAKHYRNKDEDFPGTAYLVPDPDRVTMWKSLFAAKKKPVIGIAWSGGTWQNASQYRSLPLKDWKPIFDAVDAHWVSLQYKDAAKDIKGTPVVQYPFGTLTKDYDDTAALVAACDLIVGMQTSVMHLAGALGREAWVMIPSTSQWRYGEGHKTLPWYKSVSLYHQGKDWQETVNRIAEDLRARF